MIVNDDTSGIVIRAVDDPEATRRVEICFFCRGDASTPCCGDRIKWNQLHGDKTLDRVHSPREHT
jgi:hypothetical protein